MNGFDDQDDASAAPRIWQRRRFVVRVGATAAAAALGGAWPAAQARPTPALSRLASRARYRISRDFAAPMDAQVIVPWDVTVFQTGTDFALEPGGKVRFDVPGLYEVVFSCDWEATADTDNGLRQIGIRRQRPTQPDEPTDKHERLGFVNVPGSDPPKMARFLGPWQPGLIPRGSTVTTDVTVTPAGTVAPGDLAMAGHTQISLAALGDTALNALVIQARVIAPDTVRVSMHNPSVEGGITVPNGALRVLAMNAIRRTGTSEDTWQVLHSPSTEIAAGERVYAQIQHKVEGTLFQNTRSSYFQIDRLE